MAITTQGSNQYNDVTDPRTYGGVGATFATDLRLYTFEFAQSGTGDDGSSVRLVFFQPGRYVIHPHLSRFYHSAFGASRVLDIGLSAYTADDGSSVAAALTRFDDDVNVASAAAATGIAMGSDAVAADVAGATINVGAGGAYLVATCTGGTIPDGAVLRGYLAVQTVR